MVFRMSNIFRHICSPVRNVSSAVLQSVLELAVELARQGREGRKIGTIFTKSIYISHPRFEESRKENITVVTKRIRRR
jgi:DNA integrity scanning protein DisA with diadenylate cyclase activity